MKSKSKKSRVYDRYGMIEALEPRIAPAAVTSDALPANPKFVTATVGGSLLVKAGEVLTTGSNGGGIYLLYVQQGQVLVHTTDLGNDGTLDFNDITGLSMGANARIVSFVDIHGDVVTDLNQDGTLTDGGKGDVLLDNNIASIDMRSLDTSDFVGTSTQSPAALVQAHLAMTSYSIFGNIYAGGGLGLSTDSTSGLHIDTSGSSLQATKYPGTSGSDYYQSTLPVIGSIYVGTSASGQSYSFGASGSPTDVHGDLLAFNPSPGEAGASIYNIAAASTGQAFSIGTIHAGDGGFNAAGGNIVNVALQGDTAGAYKLIAGNAGNGTTGQSGGSITNFSEAGAVIGEVVLQSGSGGTGLTGPGGSAGVINLNPASPIAINAHFELIYGNGGNGYTKGAAGGGTPSGSFITPEGKFTTALDIVSTTHIPGTVGSLAPFDFNGDGYSDAVFSTTNPDQVVVAMGNGSGQVTGLDPSSYIYLNSPAQVDSIVVGNFTGKLNPVTHQPEYDIAVASGSESFAGVEVYLSEYNPKTGAFEGFSDPLFSPLPALTNFSNPKNDPYLYTSTQITKIVAGDFSGNGVEGLAVLVNETVAVAGGTAVDPVLMFLSGETDATHPGGTGYFYANLKNGNQPFLDYTTAMTGFGSAAPGTFMFASALTTFTPNAPGVQSANHDVVISAVPGSGGFGVMDNSSGTTVVSGGGSFGQIDTNRLPSTPTTPEVTLVAFTLQAMTVIQDPKNPSIADVIALTPPLPGVPIPPSTAIPMQSYYADLTGNGTGSFNIATNPPLGMGLPATDKGDQDGFVGPGGLGLVTLPNQTTGVFSDVGLLSYAAKNTISVISPSSDLSTVAAGASFDVTVVPGTGGDTKTVVFDTFYPHPVTDPNVPGLGPTAYQFIAANPIAAGPNGQEFGISTPFGVANTAPFKIAGYFFQGGNGGNSDSGAGGAGGSFGQTLTLTGTGASTVGVGSLSVQFPADQTFQGTLIIDGGNGGNGFTAGGAGGNVSGLSVTSLATLSTSVAELQAGNGGESLTGAGGNGGSLSQMFITSGEFYIAGNGGIGTIGGSGGSVIGNASTGVITGSSNNLFPEIFITGGTGATGITGGGSGGSITSFVNHFDTVEGTTFGELQYIAGNAGDAVAGKAGTGGSVVNDSPYSLDNNFANGPIILEGGSGGNGLFGGSGGSVTTFSMNTTVKEIPNYSVIIAGSGGNATLGVGGAGGNISGIDVSASGTDGFGNPIYNRMIAGAAGTSLGGVGGAGGSVSSIDTTSVAAISQNVVAAGAGGDGLTSGGVGGSVTSASVDAGSSAGSGKVVVIAGDGGASHSSAPADLTNPAEVALAIGGVSGPGGNGGSITGFSQNLSVATHVDLIAGNGGATLNHSIAVGNAPVNGNGVAFDNSGQGGSILNASIAGSIGNSDATVAIKSYNDIFSGQTMQDFINSYILANTFPGGNLYAPMDDTIGNVGLVAGAAGHVEGGSPNAPDPGTLQPSENGISGSVANVHAQNIMSMVAGNVDQVDLIQSLTNYGVTISGGILGANKTEFYNPVSQQDQPYFNNSNVPLELGNLNYVSASTLFGGGALVDTPLPGGGELIDGAFVAKNIRVLESIRDFEGTQ